MELSSVEAMTILKTHQIEVSLEEPRTIKEIALQFIMTGTATIDMSQNEIPIKENDV